MEITKFFTTYGTNEQCQEGFIAIRQKAGIVCRICNEKTPHTYYPNYKRFCCKQCRTFTGLRAGTVMESSKIPLKYWFWAMYFMTMNRTPFSCKEVARKLEHKRYATVWFLMHKIRALMGKRDSQYQLSNEVEMDDAFVKTFREQIKTDNTSFTKGRGSERMTKMFVMTEQYEMTIKEKLRKRPKYIKMVAMEVLTADAAEMVAREYINPTSILKTDGHKSFCRLKKLFANHTMKKIPPKQAHIELQWVHTAIANVKASISGVYRNVTDKWLQNYLDEFCYISNRRKFQPHLFERILSVGLSINLSEM